MDISAIPGLEMEISVRASSALPTSSDDTESADGVPDGILPPMMAELGFQTADGFQTAVTETDPNLPDLQPHGIPLTAIKDLELRCARAKRKKDIMHQRFRLRVLLLIVLYVYVQQVYALKIRP